MADTVNDFLVRLEVHTEGDGLDFQETGRGVFVVEDGVGNMPLPRGEKGETGEKGDPGGRLTPQLIMQEVSDGAALTKLQERSQTWRTGNVNRDGYFAINQPTGSGFFYTRGGWVIYRDVFGANSEVVAGEFDLPVTFANASEEPEAPSSGVTMYAQGNELKIKKPNGTVVTLG